MSRGKTNPFPDFQYALLGQLAAGPTYGYVLHKQLSDEQGIGLIWQVKLPNLYAVLEQIEKKGWLSVTLQPGDSRPGRKIYQLTAEGRSEFEAWLTSPVTHPRAIRQDFMLKLNYLQDHQPEQVPILMRTQLSHCRTWLKSARDDVRHSSGAEPFAQSVYRFRLLQIQSMVEWLEAELRELKEPTSFIELDVE